MLVQYNHPDFLTPRRLDALLAQGWFRNAYMMYRTKVICLSSDLYSVVNIRMKLEDFKPSKKMRKIVRKNNEKFRIIIRPAILDDEKNELYQEHKSRFEGFIYNNIEQFFYGEYEEKTNIFDTYECCVYDEDVLVAVSFFDFGTNSIASLLALYRQSYRKYSLGIYTMVQEAIYAKSIGKTYFYPGYILDKNAIFDYKLRLGEMQYYNWETKRWRKWMPREQMKLDAPVFLDKILELEQVLNAIEIPFHKYLYPLFSLGYIDYNYIRSPMFLDCYSYDGNYKLVIEYWMEDKHYVLSDVSIVPFDNNPEVVEISESYKSNHNFFDLLHYENIIVATSDLDELIFHIRNWLSETEDL